MHTKGRIAHLITAYFVSASSPATTTWARRPAKSNPDRVAAGEALAERAYGSGKGGRFSESVATYLRAYGLTGAW